MNKIYKVVWSKVKNCYVVVSELAKNVISGGVKSAKVGTAPMALGVLMAFVITGNALAAEVSYENQNLKGTKTYGANISLTANSNLADYSTIIKNCTTDKNTAITINGLGVNVQQKDATINNTKLQVSGSTVEGILQGVDVSEYSAGNSEVENIVTVDNTEVTITESTLSRNIYGVDVTSYGKVTSEITDTKLAIEESDVKSAYIAGVNAGSAGATVSGVEVVMKNNNVQVPDNSYPANATIYSVIVSGAETTVNNTDLTIEGGAVNANVYAIRMDDAGAATAVAEDNTVNIIGTKENPLTMVGNVYGIANAAGKVYDIGSGNAINVNLTGEASSLTGSVYGGGSNSTTATVELSEGATWYVTDYNTIDEFAGKDGVIAIGNDLLGKKNVLKITTNESTGTVVKATGYSLKGGAKEALVAVSDKLENSVTYTNGTNGEDLTFATAVVDTELYGDVELVDVTDATGKVVGNKVVTTMDTDDLVVAGDVKAGDVSLVDTAEAIATIQTAASGNAEAISGLNQRVERLDGKLDKVGAGAAALAALHPLDYDPEEKLTFSAGVGSYGGEQAAALGMFYRPNESVMLSLGGTMGNGEEMVNLGVSFALDGVKGLAKMSKGELIQKVNDMEAENEEMKAEVAELKELVAQLLAKK